MGGQVPASFNVVGEVMPYIKGGKLRSLGITSAQRSIFLPEVPTLIEQGYKDIAVQEWLGWFLPAKTPAATVLQLNAMVREALQDPAFVAQLATYGLEPVHQSPEEFARRVKGDYERWGPIVRATGFTAED
jgi:tripartite-type tricarboxylate transporter receptor subunit TctC